MRHGYYSMGLCVVALCATMWGITQAHAQCNACDHTIAAGDLTVRGQDLNIQPGDVVCVQASDKEYLSIEDVQGAPNNRVTIVNCGGRVNVSNPDRGYGIRVTNSSHFHLTGTGDPATTYGFRVAATRTGPDYKGIAVPIGGMSTDYEVDHIEVFGAGFAGIMSKTDPTCEGSPNRGNFVQNNTHIHHNYIHDVEGEGFYIGSTGWTGRDRDCSGTTTTLYPHDLVGVHVHDNIVENSGWDGLQVGAAPSDCLVYNNTIRNVGLEGVEFQQVGIQVGGGAACDVFNNHIETGPTVGIIMIGAGTSNVYNNVVIDIGDRGILADDRGLIPGSTYRFMHNTLIRAGVRGISVLGADTINDIVYNNIIIGSTEQPLALAGALNVDAQGNIIQDDMMGLDFVDPMAHDYRLQSTSSAVDTGVAITAFTVDSDLDGTMRDAMPDVGAFEYSTMPNMGGTGGTPATGGMPSTGGMMATGGAGGMPANGGTPAAGGAAMTGGSPMGGTTPSGGTTPTGGASTGGGAAGGATTGGSTTSTGGAMMTMEAGADDISAPGSDGGSDDGCHIQSTRHTRHPSLLLGLLLALGAVFLRRRRG